MTDELDYNKRYELLLCAKCNKPMIFLDPQLLIENIHVLCDDCFKKEALK